LTTFGQRKTSASGYAVRDHDVSTMTADQMEHARRELAVFLWPWKQPIGSVDDLETVAGKIAEVLRPVAGEP
jgi:hypothetical protein